jgi:hypothetical protein
LRTRYTRANVVQLRIAGIEDRVKIGCHKPG